MWINFSSVARNNFIYISNVALKDLIIPVAVPSTCAEEGLKKDDFGNQTDSEVGQVVYSYLYL